MKLGDAINRLRVVESKIDYLTRMLQFVPEASFNEVLQEATSLIQERTQLAGSILETELAISLDGPTTIHSAREILDVLDAKEKIFTVLLERKDLKKETSELIFKELQTVRNSCASIENALDSCIKKTDLLFTGENPGN